MLMRALLLPLRMRPRVQRAPGIPCALWIQRTRKYSQASGAMRREIADTYSVVIARSNRATPAPKSRGVLDHPVKPGDDSGGRNKHRILQCNKAAGISPC